MLSSSRTHRALAAAALLAAGAVGAALVASDAPAAKPVPAVAAPARPAPAASASASPRSPHRFARATFAGGCFWCMEPPYDALDGVVSTTSGYTGGERPNPTYEQVSSGGTGHYEALQVVYDPAKVSYEKLLEVFWHNVDPLDAAGQFCDRGEQYRTAIFAHGAEQRRLAEASRARLDAGKSLPGRVVTPVLDAAVFYPAEEYHQNYYEVNPLRYNFYRNGCGRDRRLRELWGEKAGAH